MIRSLSATTALALFGALFAGNAFAADPVVIGKTDEYRANENYKKVGFLNCKGDGGIGYVVGSAKNLNCIFENFQGQKTPETYHGKIRKLGVDVGFTEETTLVWGVYVPSAYSDQYRLDGTYVGVSAEVTAGIGTGANVLVGGWKNGVNLVPLSVSTQFGLNVSAGIGSITLASN